jgi:hypothetical protein
MMKPLGKLFSAQTVFERRFFCSMIENNRMISLSSNSNPLPVMSYVKHPYDLPPGPAAPANSYKIDPNKQFAIIEMSGTQYKVTQVGVAWTRFGSILIYYRVTALWWTILPNLILANRLCWIK